MANPFKNLRAEPDAGKKSIDWYQQQVKTLGRISANKLMTNTPDMVTTILPGAMYMFFYDAKLKDKLPYWDMFPLVLPFRKVNDGFYGINLHYLPYAARFKLLEALHTFADDEKIDDNTRLKFNWNLLTGSTRTQPVKACVKHYLYENVQSRFLNIKYPDWVTAALLPVEKFVGANKTQIWRDSRKKY